MQSLTMGTADSWPEEEGQSASGDSLYGHRAEAYGWIAYLDRLALVMGFISYDTKGSYRGYSSTEPSFPDNLIHFNAEVPDGAFDLCVAAQKLHSPKRQKRRSRAILMRLLPMDWYMGGALFRLNQTGAASLRS